MNGIEGLLGDPLFNMGIGLLSAAGPSFQPNNAGQGLALGAGLAQRGQHLQLQNQATRQKLQAQAERQQALQQLPGLLGEGPQAELLGLLGQISPDAMAQGLMSQAFPSQRSEPADIRSMDALGIPRTPEGFAEFQKLKADNNLEALKAQQLQTQQQIDLLRADQLRREGKDKEAAATEKKIAARQAVTNSVDRINELIQLNERLKGGIGETGIGFSEARGLGAGLLPALTRAFGGDESKARQVATDFQRFEQLTTQEALKALANQEGLGQGTNQKLVTILQTKPGTARLPEVNNQIFGDMLQAVLDDAERQKIDVPNRGTLTQQIEQLRRQPGPRSFASEADVGKALDAGQIKKGDEVQINGKRFRVE